MLPEPRANPELIGHRQGATTLERAARSGRLPHAWLIGGPQGIGKATLAFRFARFVLAGCPARTEAPLAIDPGHPTFRRVAAGSHADLLTVARPYDEEKKRLASEVPIDAVRRIAPFLHLTPAEGGWRVVVVDEAERMNRNSANAILKVLEEPPPAALLLLVSSNPGRLLPTIRSRCRSLALAPLPEDVLADALARHFPDLAEADRTALARLADGSLGRAAELAEVGGLELYRELVGLLGSLPALDLEHLHQLAERLGPSAADRAYRRAAELLLWWLARLVRSRARHQVPAEVVAGEAALMRRLGQGAPLERWLAVWDKVAELFRRADGANLDHKQVMVRAFLEVGAAAA